MFDEDTLNSRHGEQSAGDAAILAKFREWVASVLAAESFHKGLPDNIADDHPEWLAMLDAEDELAVELAAMRSTGPAGLAIKVFIIAHKCCIDYARPHAKLAFDDGKRDIPARVVEGAIRDAVRFAPELAPLCAAVRAEVEGRGRKPSASMIREEIMQALLILVSQSSNFATFGRRLVHWGKVAAQPAAFVVEIDNEYGQHGGTFPPVRTLGAEVWIYARTDPQAPPGATLNPLLDAVELALQPPFPGAAQTLGGLVTHCWIGADDGQKAKILIDEGHFDDQAKAIIPVRMMVP